MACVYPTEPRGESEATVASLENMSSDLSVGTRHLIALGFTPLEAEMYVWLLGESPATGYRVAQGTGRTAANSYKALETLEARGAVMSDEGEPRLYRAVSPRELLSDMRATFEDHRKHASEALSRIKDDRMDDRVYQLRSPGQVFERCRTILRTAKTVVLLDVFPEPLGQLREPLDAAIKRGVRVALLVYEPVRIKGAEVVVNHQAATVRARWPAQWINLAADSAEQVHALLSPDGKLVVHGTWSASAFLAHLYQSGLLGEIAASAIRNSIRKSASLKGLEAVMRRLDRFEHADTPAFTSLTRSPTQTSRRRKR